MSVKRTKKLVYMARTRKWTFRDKNRLKQSFGLSKEIKRIHWCHLFSDYFDDAGGVCPLLVPLWGHVIARAVQRSHQPRRLRSAHHHGQDSLCHRARRLLLQSALLPHLPARTARHGPLVNVATDPNWVVTLPKTINLYIYLRTNMSWKTRLSQNFDRGRCMNSKNAKAAPPPLPFLYPLTQSCDTHFWDY